MKLFKILIICLLPFLITGCYDRKELDDLAYVIALGMDKGENENLNITYQIAIPLKISGTDSKSGKENYTNYTVSAPSLYLGNSEVNTLTSKEVNLSNVKLIVYSEDLAKEDLTGHISELIANVDIRPKTTLAICKGKSEDFLSEISPVLEASPARFYELFFSSSNYTNKTISSELIDFYTSAQNIQQDAHAIILENKKEEDSEKSSNQDSNSSEQKNTKIETTGIAVFNGGTMIGEIPITQALPHLIIKNDLNQGVIGIPDIYSGDETVSLSISPSRKNSIKVYYQDSVPHAQITAHINAHILSSESTTDYIDKENRNTLKESLEQEISKQICEYLILLKELNSDIVGIGNYAKNTCLTWEEFENLHWKDNFKNCVFEIKTIVDLNVSETAFHRLPNV